MQVYTIKRYINADKLQFIDFHFALHSPCTIFEEDNQKNLYLIEYQIGMKELRIYGNDLAKVQVH